MRAAPPPGHGTGRAAALLAALALCLPGCLPSVPASRSAAPPPEPRVRVAVAPTAPAGLAGKRALLLPLEGPGVTDRRWRLAFSRELRDVLLRRRLCAVVELRETDAPAEGGPELLERAAAEGYDLVIRGGIPSLLFPSDVTAGLVALRLRVTSTRTGTTLWILDGEADLRPRLGMDLVVAEVPHRPAPGVFQGFSAVAEAMADVMARSERRSP